MGKVIKDEDLKLNIIVNGNQGLKELGELDNAARKLTNETKQLATEKKKLIATGKHETETYKKVTSELRKNEEAQQKLIKAHKTETDEYAQLSEAIKKNKAEKRQLENSNRRYTQEYQSITTAIKANNLAITENKEKMKVLKKQVGLTGLTMKQLRREATFLRNKLDNVIPETRAWKKYRADLKKVETRIAKVKGRAVGIRASLNKMAAGFNQYFGMIAAGSAALFGLVATGKELITGNAKLSDSYADVAKTTGLSIEEVKRLDKTMKQIDTRTSRAELLGLAEMAGKLGVTGSKNIEGFVKSADQINVALGKDLGGNAEEAIKQVGKLVDIFKVKDEFGLDQGMLKVGSTINALGAASTANEGYIVEFSKRMAGIAPAADLSIPSVMGLGATLDSLGQTSEISSTVFSQIIPNMFKDTATYAEIAGMKTKDFSKLLNEDANEAMIRLLEGLNGNNDGLGTMVKKMDQLGMDGKRSISVLGVMASNTETLREQQALANLEFDKGTSLTNEFNLKNTNLAATLEKIAKRLRGMFVNSSVTNGLKTMVGHIERWTRTKLSDTLEQERKSVLDLQLQINDSNITVETRRKLLEKLKAINPDITKGIDAEAISYETLNKNIEVYNGHLIDRIMLQKKQEQIDAYKDDHVQGRREDLANSKLNIRETFTDYYDQLKKLGGDAAKAAQEIMNKNFYDNGNAITQVDKLVKIKSLAAQEGISTFAATTAIYEYEQAKKWFDHFEKELKDMRAERDALSKELGLDKPTSSSPDTKTDEQLIEEINQQKSIDLLTKHLEHKNNLVVEAAKNRIAYLKTLEDKDIESTDAREKRLHQWHQKELAMFHGGEKEYVEYLLNRKSEDQHYYDYRKQAQKEIKEHGLLMQKQQMETERLTRETAYLEELNAAEGNEQLKADITEKYQLEEIEHQKANIKTAIDNTRKEIEKYKDDTSLDLYSEELLNAHLLRLAELENELAKLNGEEIEIKINSEDDGETKQEGNNRLIFGGQTSKEAYEIELAELENQNAQSLLNEEEFLNAKAELNRNYLEQKLDEYSTIAQAINQVIGAMSNFTNQRYETELDQLKYTNKLKLKEIDEKEKEELAKLDKKHQKGLLSDKKYEKAVNALKTKSAEQRDALNEKGLENENIIRQKQFEMNKKLGMIQAIINTAISVTSALTIPPPAGPILAVANAAAGALEVATISAQKYTPQAFEGGYQNVIGEQDGKSYNAKVQKQGGGYYPTPTLLVGEDPEYVIPNEGLANPTIARMLPVIEDARTSGTLRDITPEVLFGTATYSRQKSEGGFSQADASADLDTPDYEENDSSIEGLLVAAIESQNRLSSILEKGIVAQFTNRTIKQITEQQAENSSIERQVSQ